MRKNAIVGIRERMPAAILSINVAIILSIQFFYQTHNKTHPPSPHRPLQLNPRINTQPSTTTLLPIFETKIEVRIDHTHHFFNISITIAITIIIIIFLISSSSPSSIHI